jgi:hypothetical protein
MKTPQEMAQELILIPQAVYDIHLELIEVNDLVEANEKAIVELEIEIKSQVLNAIDDSGKKMYTNDEARKMAFVSDCNESSEHRELIAKRSEFSKQMQLKRIEVEMLSNKQRNLRVLIESFAGIEIF